MNYASVSAATAIAAAGFIAVWKCSAFGEGGIWNNTSLTGIGWLISVHSGNNLDFTKQGFTQSSFSPEKKNDLTVNWFLLTISYASKYILESCMLEVTFKWLVDAQWGEPFRRKNEWCTMRLLLWINIVSKKKKRKRKSRWFQFDKSLHRQWSKKTNTWWVLQRIFFEVQILEYDCISKVKSFPFQWD